MADETKMKKTKKKKKTHFRMRSTLRMTRSTFRITYAKYVKIEKWNFKQSIRNKGINWRLNWLQQSENVSIVIPLMQR